MRSGLQSGFLLEMAKGVDLKKDVDEVHAVYFKHNKEISKQVFKDCNNGEIFFADDLLQHAWRDRLKKRFEDKVVSKAAVLLNVSRNKEESEESITNKLSALGIKVDDFVPEFTREELKVFYSQIDKWWDEFCDDIHFADVRSKMHDALLDYMDKIRDPFRSYQWNLRPWRKDAQPRWMGAFRPRPQDGYSPVVRDYDTGLPTQGVKVEEKKQKF